jgi:hypothetical protein
MSVRIESKPTVMSMIRNLLLFTVLACSGIASFANPSLSKPNPKKPPATTIKITPAPSLPSLPVKPTASEEKKYSIKGSFQLIANTLHRGSIFSGGFSKCLGFYITGDRDPIEMDSIPLKLLDSSGKIIGISKFENGQVSARNACEFEFTFKSISKSDFYSLEVGTDGKLGKKSFSFEEMEKEQWKLRIGSNLSNISR